MKKLTKPTFFSSFIILLVMVLPLSPNISWGQVDLESGLQNNHSTVNDKNSLITRSSFFPTSKLSLWHMSENSDNLHSQSSLDSAEHFNISSDNKFTSRVRKDLSYSFRTTLSDFLHIYSSPSRWDKYDYMLASGLLLTGGVIYHYDQQIYDMLDRNRDEPFYKPIRKTGEFFEPMGFMGFTNKYFFLSIFTGYIFNIEPMVSIPADILETYVITGAAKNALNISVGRRRPEKGMGPRSYKFADGTSFPSGHALSIVQVASIISYHYDHPIVKTAAYTMAATVCLERSTSGKHWPSDVYTGAVFGWFATRELLNLKRNRNLSITPVFYNNSQGIEIRMAYRF